ncbi:MAG: DUF21 domain-containing protein [Bacilli bacterium]|nr:DUF21 domain-containing protein [Bacilli bacterium]
MSREKRKKKNLVDYKWITQIIILSFVISVAFSFISETAIPNLNIFFGIILTLVFVLIGVVFDMVGVAVAAADESQFHSMAARKVKGAKMAVRLKKNADRVASFCNDVVGDICGIISGSTGAVIALKIIEKTNLNDMLVTLTIMGIISALTIGGKAIEKGFAMKKSNQILFNFARILSIFNK